MRDLAGLNASARAPGGFTNNPSTAKGIIMNGLAAWYDFSDISTLFKDAALTVPVTANLDAVLGVQDKSGNGCSFTQVAAPISPVYRTNRINGLSTIVFDGVDDFLTGGTNATALVNGCPGWTAYFVDAHSAVGGVARFPFFASTSASTAATRENYQRNASSNTSVSTRIDNADTLVTTATATNPGDDTPVVEALLLDFAAKTVEFRRNGSAAGTATPTSSSSVWPSNNALAMYLGRGATGGFWPGQFGEILIYKRVLTSDENAQTLAYLRAKWGI